MKNEVLIETIGRDEPVPCCRYCGDYVEGESSCKSGCNITEADVVMATEREVCDDESWARICREAAPGSALSDRVTANLTIEHPSTWTATRCANEAGASLRYNGYRLGVGLPSAGADYLTRVVTDVLERIESDPDGEGHTYRAPDVCIPVPTYEKWDVFHDLYAWTEDLTEYGGPEADMTDNATIAIYMIGCRLAESVVAALDEG